MKYDAELGDCGRLFDANGQEILHAVRCDTESGLVTVLEVNEMGNYFVDPDNGEEAKKRVERHIAPLRFERKTRKGRI